MNVNRTTPAYQVWSGSETRPFAPQRWVIFVGVALLLVLGATREMTVSVLADAYWQVASYVAATLAVFYWLQAKFSASNRLTTLLRQGHHYQCLFAGLMGVLPGCGGAIIVITQFVKGRLSFGAVVTVLVATMGDAAFLLLAANPSAGAQVLGTSLVVGVITGLVVDRLHGTDFARPVMPPPSLYAIPDHSKAPRDVQGAFWKVALWPTVVVALLGSFQYDVDVLLSLQSGTMTLLGASLAMVSLAFFTVTDQSELERCVSAPLDQCERTLFRQVAIETNRVMGWVVCGFLLFELVLLATGADLTALLSGMPGLVILLAILIGCIPGCGPQIITTTLFISGAIPFSAQLGNAISNDGDALFPAIALAPRAALIATVYSTIPALIVAYSYALLFE